MKIAFIGGGNMGEAMLAAVVAKKIAGAEDITVSDIAESRCQALAQRFGVTVTTDNVAAVQKAEVIVLAIKPQTLPDVMGGLKRKITPGQLVVSIIAGTRLGTLENGLDHKVIVRSMPNTPAQIGEGVTVWVATQTVTQPQRELTSHLLGAMGKEIYVTDEKFLDMATAVSGSGPAYLFYFVEAFIDAAMAIGWPKEIAKELVLGTVYGATHLIEHSGKDARELRYMVTSRGGTTEAALNVFQDREFADIMKKAVRAAHEKAKQLGNPSDKQ